MLKKKKEEKTKIDDEIAALELIENKIRVKHSMLMTLIDGKI